MVPGFPANIFRQFFNNFKNTFWPPALAGAETIFRKNLDHQFWQALKHFCSQFWVVGFNKGQCPHRKNLKDHRPHCPTENKTNINETEATRTLNSRYNTNT